MIDRMHRLDPNDPRRATVVFIKRLDGTTGVHDHRTGRLIDTLPAPGGAPGQQPTLIDQPEPHDLPMPLRAALVACAVFVLWIVVAYGLFVAGRAYERHAETVDIP